MSAELSFLYDTDFEIRDIAALYQDWWKPGETFTMRAPRKDDAFLLFLTGGTLCTPEKKKAFTIPEGSLVYVARGSKYTWQFPDIPAPLTLLLEFTLTDRSGGIIRPGEGISIVDTDIGGEYETLINRLITEFSRPSSSPFFMKLYAYSFFAAVIKRSRKRQVISRLPDTDIYGGIKYLEGDATQEKSIAEIARMCNMSLSTFERRFKAYSGMSPVEYRLIKRLDRAETLFKTGAMTVDRIAEELGFYDAAYLCRVFKKKKGYCLSDPRRK